MSETPTIDTIRAKTSKALVAEARRDPTATGYRFRMLDRLDSKLFAAKMDLLETYPHPPKPWEPSRWKMSPLLASSAKPRPR